MKGLNRILFSLFFVSLLVMERESWRTRKRGPYKRYHADPAIPIPKSTRARWMSNGTVQNAVQKPNENDNVDHISVFSESNLFVEENLENVDQLNDEELIGTFDSNTDSEHELAEVGSDSDAAEETHDDVLFQGLVYNEVPINGNRLSDGDEPLYPGSNVTIAQSILLHMAFIMKHHLTKAALEDYLNLINTLYPTLAPTTKYLFLKAFDMQKAPNLHYYCSNCHGHISDDSALECLFCDEPFNRKTAYEQGKYIFTFDLEDQIRNILENNVVDLDSKPGYISGISDGSLYRDKVKENELSLTLNCDGLSIFKSSTYQIWPVQFIINELSPQIRFKTIIIGGLWFGYTKPIFNVYLPPLVNMLNKLSEVGVQYFDKHSGTYVLKHIKTLLASCDAPARAAVKNIAQFNGYYGCDYCLHEGISVAKGKGHAIRFPYSFPEPKKRTNTSHARHAIKAEAEGRVVKGVKGPSYLSLVADFDLVSGFAADYMHQCLLGVARYMVTDLWLDSSNHGNPWYIKNRLDALDTALLSIKRPREITRVNRSLSTTVHWKASEWRAFTLFYSVPVLQGILPEKYLNHWILFVGSLHVLLQRRIKFDDLDAAELALKKFIIYIPTLYGLENVSYNIHLLIHLVDIVRNCGPLWATSTFPFEGAFVHLKKLFNGTQAISQQICSNFLMWLDLKQKLEAYSHLNASASFINMSNKLITSNNHIKKARKLSNELVALGAGKFQQLTPEQGAIIGATYNEYQWPELYNATIYTKFVYKNSLIQSKNMGAQKRCDCYFQLENRDFCEIQYLLCICLNYCKYKCNCNNILTTIIVKTLDTSKAIRQMDRDVRLQCEFLYDFNERHLAAHDINDLWRKAVYMQIGNRHFLSPLPNQFERD